METLQQFWMISDFSFCFFTYTLQISTVSIKNFHNEKAIVKHYYLGKGGFTQKIKPKSSESKRLFSIHFSRKYISLEKYRPFEGVVIILIVKDTQQSSREGQGRNIHMADIQGEYNSCQQDSVCSADALSFMITGVKGHMWEQ